MSCAICCVLGILASAADDARPAPSNGVAPAAAPRTVLAQLGKEHLAQATHRCAADGPRIVAWGDRVLEWSLARPELSAVVPARAGLEYSNGGCALDIDGDGVDEVVVARGKGGSVRDPELLWFQEAPGRRAWAEHKIADLGASPTAPHDIRPITL